MGNIHGRLFVTCLAMTACNGHGELCVYGINISFFMGISLEEVFLHKLLTRSADANYFSVHSHTLP